jgi:hypothetical protein
MWKGLQKIAGLTSRAKEVQNNLDLPLPPGSYHVKGLLF